MLPVLRRRPPAARTPSVATALSPPTPVPLASRDTPHGSGLLKWCAALVACVLPLTAFAGAPYLTDDPEPTNTGHYEIYFFGDGAFARDGHEASTGIDFNYGAGANLQLTATMSMDRISPRAGTSVFGFGNLELAVKYKFLQQQDAGVDVAFFPSVILPSGSSAVGERHASLMLPLWLQRTSGNWTMFGGGGYEIHRGGDAKDFCVLGFAVTRQVNERLQVGAELFRQTADTRHGVASTDFNVGVTYDLNQHFHLTASAGTGLQNRDQSDRVVWYASLLWTG